MPFLRHAPPHSVWTVPVALTTPVFRLSLTRALLIITPGTTSGSDQSDALSDHLVTFKHIFWLISPNAQDIAMDI